MNRVLYIVMMFLMMALPSASESATVIYNGEFVVGISDLEVGSDHYNVFFEYGSFEDIFTTPPDTPYFWGDEDKTLAAIDSINSALNDESPIPDIIESQGLNVYRVPFEYYDFGSGFGFVVYTHQGNRSGDNSYSSPYSAGNFSALWIGDPYYYAKLTAVPLPATVFLLGSGLIGLVGLRKKIIK